MPSRIYEIPDFKDKESYYTSYLLSSNGFLPAEQPLKCLPDIYYHPWEEILSNLPELIRQKSLRDKINNLDILTTTRLNTEAEWRRAYVVLSFLTHGYIWGGDSPAQILPPSITIPFLAISNHHGLPPIATYAGLNLWNFTSPTNDFTDLDNLHALHTFSGTEDESWFYVLSVAVEAQGASIIPVMLQAIEEASADGNDDDNILTTALDEMASCITQLTRLLSRMSEKCDPMVFYHQIRPFLAGTKNMEAAGLPKRGVFYDEGNDVGKWRELRGGSNGQSSLIQFFDIVLGIEHGRKKGCEMSFHEEVRNYMPTPHRQFLADISHLTPIRDLVSNSPSKELLQAFTRATRAFGDFRSAHMQMVSRYIIVPSQKAKLKLNPNPYPYPVRRKNPGLTGTGGTELIPFLRTTRDETYRAGEEVVAGRSYSAYDR
ncbi:Indoleamine 2,3-dioxygenase [Poronia punctata]|nr:Indoleamine 2,3-dioxygenase [Poronia punctata]